MNPLLTEYPKNELIKGNVTYPLITTVPNCEVGPMLTNDVVDVIGPN